MGKIINVIGDKQMADDVNDVSKNIKNNQKKEIPLTRYVLEQPSGNLPMRSKHAMDIPLCMIKPRHENNFIMCNIEELAESIEKIGLLQPILVKEDKDDPNLSYIVISGHRRFAALQLLYSKDPNKYEYISAIVFSSDSTEEEIKAYIDSNAQQRITTLFEAIAVIKPEKINMKDADVQKEYITTVYGSKDEYESKIVNGMAGDKFDSSSKARYVTKLINQYFPNIECKIESVRKYLRLYENLTPELRKKIYSGEISINDAWNYAKLADEEQNSIAKASSEEETKEIIKEIQKKDKENWTSIKKEKNQTQINLKKIDKWTNVIYEILKTTDIDNIKDSKQKKKIKELNYIISKYISE